MTQTRRVLSTITRPRVQNAVISAIAALLSATGFARPVALPDLERLTDDSNLVAIVDIASVRVLRAIEFPDHTKGEQVTATMNVSEVRKGSVTTNVLDVTYDQNPDPRTGGPWTQSLRSGGPHGPLSPVFDHLSHL